MIVTIEYCLACNYQPRAIALADAVRQAHPAATVVMTESGGGRFEVSVDGTPIFEKSKVHRHALPGEVLGLLNKHLAN